MKKIISAFGLCFVFAIFAVFGVVAIMPQQNFASAQQQAFANANVKDENVHYDEVRKVISIDRNKKLNITEYITVTYAFDKINVGLSRNVSRINKITRIVDGKKYVTRTVHQLELLSVKMDGKSEYNFLEVEGDYYYINTGADFDYKVGQHTYEINYTYTMGEDFIKQFDDFTFDIMDYGFRSPVDKFSAQVTLPKDFLQDKELDEILTLRSNDMIEYNKAQVKVVDNTINITAEKFGTRRGLTMQLILPQGYFETTYQPSGLYWAMFALSIVVMAVIALIIFISWHPKKAVETVEFTPPDGLNPVDVARIYRGKVKDKDLASLIISWAGKGLIDIKMISKRHIVLTKLKDFPDPEEKNNMTESEKYFLDCKYAEGIYFYSIFPGKKNVFDTKKEKHKTHKAIYKAAQELSKSDPKAAKKRIFLKIAIEILAVVPMIFYLVWAKQMGFAEMFYLFIILFPFIGLNVFFHVRMGLAVIWFKLIWCGMFAGVPLYMLLSQLSFSMDTFGLLWIATIIFVLGIASTCLVRTYGKFDLEMRGRVLGFKRFLQTAELAKLEMLVAENPSYYYDILPYCYVFGITQKMEAKFAELKINPPEYCTDCGSFYVLASSLSHSMGSMGGSSVSSGSGGGGGGGGGSSGGGGGGGGCGGR